MLTKTAKIKTVAICVGLCYGYKNEKPSIFIGKYVPNGPPLPSN